MAGCSFIAAPGQGYDLAVVGAGIVGPAHALAAVRRGRRVIVIDREPVTVGASIRNFGFVTVSGQERGRHWQRARAILKNAGADFVVDTVADRPAAPDEIVSRGRTAA